MAKVYATYEDIQIGAGSIMDHCSKGVKFVGFDTETTVTRKEDQNLVSTIQISYIVNKIPHSYIFQVYRVWREGAAFSPILRKILQSKEIIKVGVDITTDMNRIFNSYGIVSAGYLDIQSIAVTMDIPCSSLNDLCGKYIPTYIYKDPIGHKGDWDGDLNDNQILYGSRDALYSYVLYGKIMDLKIDDVVINEGDELDILCVWIKNAMKVSTRDRPIESIVNQICNSYRPWANRYTKEEKVDRANRLIQVMNEKDLLRVSHGNIVADRPDIMTIDMDKETREKVKGMKYVSAYNYLINSYGPLVNYPKEERKKWIMARLKT